MISPPGLTDDVPAALLYVGGRMMYQSALLYVSPA